MATGGKEQRKERHKPAYEGDWYADAQQEKAAQEADALGEEPETCELFDGTVMDRKKMWEIPKYTPEELKRCVVDETSFATIFPTYLETYLQKIWPAVQLVLQKHHCAGELNLTEGSMTVRTTKTSWDPWAIVKARDFIRLLSRSVPLQQASKIFEEEMFMEIIKIGGYVTSKERFVKRRQRLMGPEGKTLKALELLTDCYILVQGKTVAAMGPYKGLQAVKQIVEDCMRNIHPIYGLKRLLIKRELSKDQELKVHGWAKWLPEFKKTNLKRAKRKKIRREAKLKSPFPPPQTPRKEDLQMETGEYWLTHKDNPRRRRAAEGDVPPGKRARAEAEEDDVAPRGKGKKSKRPQPEAESDE
eukprot:EG_transcript_11668